MTRNSSLAIYQSQALYDGEIEEAGEVVILFENGWQYEGFVSNGNLNGEGKFYSPDNKLFCTGIFVEGKLNGEATICIDPAHGGGIYRANFRDGKSDIGTHIDDKFAKFMAYFKDGKLLSPEEFYLENGRTYQQLDSVALRRDEASETPLPIAERPLATRGAAGKIDFSNCHQSLV